MADVQAATPPADQALAQAAKTSYDFNFSDFLRREYRFGLDPDRPLCKAYMQGHCPMGNRCPDKHQTSSSYNKYVCAMRSPHHS